MSYYSSDVSVLKKELSELDKRRDHLRALLSDAELTEKLCKPSYGMFVDSDASIAILKEKIAKRAQRRAKELSHLGSYVRPGEWDDDLDDYQEDKYEEDVGGGYKIRLTRATGMNWNGYVILPSDHPAIGKHYEFFGGATPGLPSPPVHLTYGGVDPHIPSWTGRQAEPGVYGFYQEFGEVSPHMYYSEHTRFYSSYHHFTAERTSGYRTYATVRSICIELADYFKSLASDPVLSALCRDYTYCFDCNCSFIEFCKNCECGTCHVKLDGAGACVYCATTVSS